MYRGLLRDSNGNWVRGFYGNIGFADILKVELSGEDCLENAFQ